MMMETLGVVGTQTAILKMIRDVDTDGNDEIDFDELCQIVAANSGSTQKGASGISFGSLIERVKKAGPTMVWRTDAIGKGLEVESTSLSCKAGPKEWGVAMTCFGEAGPDGAWLSAKQYSEATCLLELTSLGGDAYVGIAGINFKARDAAAGEWNIELGKSADQPGMAPWAAIKLSTGEVYKKGKPEGGQILSNVQEGDRISYDIDMHNQTATIRSLRLKANSDASAMAEWEEKSKVEISNLPPELCVAVSLGNNAEGKSTAIRLVGSWCAVVAKSTEAKDVDTGDPGAKQKADPLVAAAQSSGA